MKISSRTILAVTLCLALNATYGQFGPQSRGSQGIRFNGAMAKLFGDNRNFSANLEMQMKGGAVADSVTMPGKITVAGDNSVFEMDATQIKSASMPESAVAQMKAMGMDKMVMISRPDKKVSYIIYPNLKAHAETAMPETEAAEKDTDFKIETTDLGKETVDGHPCAKAKVVLTDPKGKKDEMTIWKASDLKQFPIKVERTEGGTLISMTFKDVKLSKPDSKMFDPPADSTKYESMQALMQGVMSKRFGQGGAGKQEQ